MRTQPYTWKVTSYGLEAFRPGERRAYYSIDKRRLSEERDGMSDWVLHLADTKSWFSADVFEPAFREALKRHKTRYTFDIDRSFLKARLAVADHAFYDSVCDRAFPGKFMWSYDDMMLAESYVARARAGYFLPNESEFG